MDTIELSFDVDPNFSRKTFDADPGKITPESSNRLDKWIWRGNDADFSLTVYELKANTGEGGELPAYEIVRSTGRVQFQVGQVPPPRGRRPMGRGVCDRHARSPTRRRGRHPPRRGAGLRRREPAVVARSPRRRSPPSAAEKSALRKGRTGLPETLYLGTHKSGPVRLYHRGARTGSAAISARCAWRPSCARQETGASSSVAASARASTTIPLPARVRRGRSRPFRVSI